MEPHADTTIRKVAPNTNDGSDDLLVIRGGSDTHRILYREELFDEPVTVLAAKVQLYMASDTTAQTPRQVSILEMSPSGSRARPPGTSARPG